MPSDSRSTDRSTSTSPSLSSIISPSILLPPARFQPVSLGRTNCPSSTMALWNRSPTKRKCTRRPIPVEWSTLVQLRIRKMNMPILACTTLRDRPIIHWGLHFRCPKHLQTDVDPCQWRAECMRISTRFPLRRRCRLFQVIRVVSDPDPTPCTRWDGLRLRP